MFEAPASPYLVPFDGSFRLTDAPQQPPDDAPGKKSARKQLRELKDEMDDLQRRLYAEDHHAVLLVFQAMDAAGKDSTIRAVTRGMNPAGFQVASFKRPSSNELDQDFLWRSTKALPQRGRIGVFNRSYYEEVLVVRVHPQILDAQRIPHHLRTESIWSERLESIRDHERHLARNGTVILKFFLNVSRDAQRARFLSRLDEPHKHWKFEVGDVRERGHWNAYMAAYQDALASTSCAHAPWYAIPADDKPFMRLTVATIVRDALAGLGLSWPEVDPKNAARFDEMRRLLEEDA